MAEARFLLGYIKANDFWRYKFYKMRDELSDYLMTCEYVGLKERSEIISIVDKYLEDKNGKGKKDE